jgi:hypothetical protein
MVHQTATVLGKRFWSTTGGSKGEATHSEIHRDREITLNISGKCTVQ